MTLLNIFFSTYLSIALVILHPLKMTTSKVVIGDSIDVTINFFFDDFHEHLISLYQIDIEPLGSEEQAIIEDYINQNFAISLDTNPANKLTIKTAGFIEENILQVKLSSPSGKGSHHSINITNTLLFDAFPSDQENIVHLVTKGSDTKMMHFSIQESIQKIEFD